MNSVANKASLIKARYAIALVRTAKYSDRATALRLIESLAADEAAPGESQAVAEAHRHALGKFADLAQALRNSRDAGHLWFPAERATQRWADLAGDALGAGD